MPINMPYKETEFNQMQYISQLTDKRIERILNQTVGFSHPQLVDDIKSGLCYGLSTYYLMSMVSGKETEFILEMERLANEVNSDDYISSDPIFSAYIESIKEKSNQLLNKYLTTIIRYQYNKDSANDIYEYIRNYWLPEVNVNESFIDYLQRMYQYNEEYHPNKNNVNLQHYHKKFIYLMERYFNALFESESYFTTEEGEGISHSNAFNKIKTLYGNRLDVLKNNIEKYDVQYFFDTVASQVKHDLLNDSDKIMRDYGLSTFTTENVENYYGDADYYNTMTLGTFFKLIAKKNEPAYYSFLSDTHAMAFAIEKHAQSNKLIYKFFDPNKGEVQYESIDDIRNFIMSPLTDEDSHNDFDTIDRYPIYIREYNKTLETKKIDGLEYISENEINISAASLLVKNKTKIYLDDETAMVFENYNVNNNILKIKLISKKNEITIYTDSLNINELKERLIENSGFLSNYNGKNIFLSQDKYKVYKIDDINKISEIKANNIELLLGESSGLLSENIEDFFQKEMQHIHTTDEELSILASKDHSSEVDIKQSQLVEYELAWLYPTENPELIPKYSPEDSAKLDNSNFEHNVIFQLEYDPDAINKGSAALIGKHPKNTTLIHYDIKNKHYEIVYGDEKRVVEGKTRWLVAGHGTTKKGQPILFADLNPQELVKGLFDIKNHLSTLQSPDKIVLIGCSLASGDENNNFARNTVELFHQKGFDVPIVAYTEDLYVYDDGRKGSMRDINYRDEGFKLIYKWDKKNNQILVNDNPEILFLCDKIRNSNVEFNALVNNNKTILARYFNNEQGELDVSLLKRVIYINEGYHILNETLNSSSEIIEADFYKTLVGKLEYAGIDKTPIWKTINNQYITDNSLLEQSQYEDTLDIIFRMKDNESVRGNAERVVIKKPNNTLIIQVDVENGNTFVEYGNIDKLSKSTKQNWKIIDYAGREESYSGIYAQILSDGLLLAKEKFNLANPGSIDFININKSRKPYYLNESLFLANNILIKLSSNNIKTDLYLESYNNSNDMIVDDQFINKTKFSYNSDEHIVYINDEHQAKYIMTDIASNRLPLHELNFHDYPSLIPYLSYASGELDLSKLFLIINDPFVNRNINEYFSNQEYLHPEFIDLWNDRINSSKITTLKQKAIDTAFLLNAIYENPNIISYLGKHASKLLSDLFPQENGYHIGEVLDVIGKPHELTILQGKINAFIGLEWIQAFEGLSLKETLNKSHLWNSELLENYVSMQSITNNYELDTQVNFINNGFYLADDSNENRVFKQVLGQLYAFCKDRDISNDQSSFIDIVNYAVLLNTKKETVTLSREENLFLVNYRSIIFHLMKEISYDYPSSLGSIIKNSSFKKWLSEASSGKYQIKSLKGDFLVVIEKNENIYRYSFYDPEGLETVFSHKDKNKVVNSFLDCVFKYLDRNPGFFENKSYSQNIDDNKDFIVDIEKISINDHVQKEIQEKINELIIPKKNIIEMVNIEGVIIPAATLHRLGATIDNIPLNDAHIKNSNFYKNIKFNTETLSSRLTFIEGNKEDAILIKLLKKVMINRESRDIINSDSDMVNYSILLKQLDYINHYTDLQQDHIDIQLWHKLQGIGIKLPRYVEMMNRTGQAMTAAGFITLITSTYGMMQQLDNPLLSADERAEIHKNLGIAWASGIVNLSDIAQPTLLKIAYQQTGSFKVAGTLAGHVSIGLLLIGIGFDIYNTYANLSKLAVEKNSAARQDLLVNGSLSLVGIGVGVASIMGMLASAAAAGPFGIIAGAALMFGGMIYNAIRAVNKIKEQISLTADEEFTTGARAALGLPPVISVQNKLRQKATEEAMVDAEWQYDQQFFINTVLPSGFDTHIYAGENITAEGEDGYYLVDDDGDYFGGALQAVGYDRFLASLGLISDDEMLRYYSKTNATLFSLEDAELLLRSNSLILPSGELISYPSGKMSDHYHIEKAELKRYPNEQQKKSDEIIILDHKYDISRLPPHVEYFIGLNQGSFVLSEGAEILRLYTVNAQGLDDKNKGQKLDKKSFTEFDNIKDINSILNQKRQQSGFSFNSANGNDVIIGHKDEKNSFEIHEGNKVFIGGDNQDRFYYLNNKRAELENIKDSNKSYFDGQGGDDTLILGSYNDGVHIEIDLNKGEIRQNTQNISYAVATLDNIENIVGHANYSETLIGNDKNNYLDGSGGNDKLYAHGGNDRLVLDQGYANGGLGNDSYFIRKYKWSNYAENLFRNKKFYSRKEKRLVNRRVLNESFNLIKGYNYNSQVIIDEDNNDTSLIELDYSLKHINQAELQGNDLHLLITSRPYQITKNISSEKYCNESIHTIILKNVYRDSLDGKKKIVNHQYTLKTKDGFLLSNKLSDYEIKDSTTKLIFDINYISSQDKYIKINYKNIWGDSAKYKLVTDIYANSKNHSMEIITKGKRQEENSTQVFRRNYIAPSWGKFSFSGSSGKLGFSGDDENNTLVSIGNDSYIYASKGNDYYSISNTDIHEQQEYFNKITFDFSRLAYPNGYIGYNNNLTSDDKIIIMLENESANDLIIDNNILYFGYKGNPSKVPIEFVNFDRSITNAIFIHDKYKNIYSVNINAHGGELIGLNQPKIATNKSDYIRITNDYLSKYRVIDGKEGNDIILDISGEGRGIKGSQGNDIITVQAGNNIIYGGQGDDKLYGGNNDDILLVTDGDDQLFGGKGDDRYLIDGDTIGNVIVEDNEGTNKFYLMNFKHKQITNTIENEEYISEVYHALNDGTLTVIRKKIGAVNNSVYIDNTLNDKLIYKMQIASKSIDNNLVETLFQYISALKESSDGINLNENKDREKKENSIIYHFDRLVN